MRTLVYTNPNGVSVTFDEGTFAIASLEGLGAPGVEIQEQKAPFHDGSVAIDQIMEPREIVLRGIITVGNDNAARYAHRRTLMVALNPKLGPGEIVYTNDEGSWSINGLPRGPVFSNKNANDGNQEFLVTFYCHDPYWSDESETVLSDNGDILSLVIDNTGDVETPIELELSTIAASIDVKNATTGEEMHLSDTVDIDVTYKINTAFGNKRVQKLAPGLSLHNAETFNDIAYSPDSGFYCAVGAHGLIAISKDRETWRQVEVDTDETLTSVAYSEDLGLFCAVGYTGLSKGIIFTSADGVHWTVREDDGDTPLMSVKYSSIAKIFFAVGHSYLYTSPDCITWTEHFVANVQLYSADISIMYGRWVVVGAGGVIYNADYPAMASWDLKDSTVEDDLYDVVCSLGRGFPYDTLDGYTVACGANGAIIYSENTFTWVDDVSGVTIAFRRIAQRGTDNKRIVCGEGGYVFYANGSSGFTGIATELTSDLHSIIYNSDEDVYVVCGANGSVQISSDETGAAWTVDAYLYCLHVNAIDYSPTLHQWCIGGTAPGKSGGFLATSEDGVAWELFLTDNVIQDILWIEERALWNAVGSVSDYLTSGDGVNWTYELLGRPSTGDFYGIAYSKSLDALCIVGSDNVYSQYEDVWENIAPGSVSRVAYFETKHLWCVVGPSGLIKTSVNGIDWTTRTSGTTEDLYDVKYIENLGLLVAVGEAGTILYSGDGVAWTAATSGSSTYLYGLNYSESLQQIIAVGYDNTVLTSPDGITWTATTLPGDHVFNDAAYSEESGVWGLASYEEPAVFIGPIEDEYVNAIEDLSTDSVFFQAEVGTNIIIVQCDVGEVYATLRYKKRYLGV